MTRHDAATAVRCLFALALLLLPRASFAALGDGAVDVSHGWGVPLGGIGTGYSMFGPYGFVRVNFDGLPDPFVYARDPASREDYTREPGSARKARFGFLVRDGRNVVLLASKRSEWMPGIQLFDRATSHACLPKGFFTFESAALQLTVSVSAFSPLSPHDLPGSTVPAQVYDLTFENTAAAPRTIDVGLEHARPMKSAGDTAVLEEERGQLAFAVDGGRADERGVHLRLDLQPGRRRTARFYVAWHYPRFRTLSPAAPREDTRHYTRRFPGAREVLAEARASAGRWLQAIDRWHASLDVPPPLKRLWFASLASVITSSLMTADGKFFEIETPHAWINTMDVLAYSNWVYLINWPELERADMNQFFDAIPATGANAGFVWHSLFDDAADYAEEPTFLTRVWRDSLWFGDPAWLATAFPHALRAANRTYGADSHEFLINSKKGNQSYDLWKMPGVSAYVNIAWVHGLYALERMSATLGRPALVGGVPAGELRVKAAASLDRLLWNERGGYWNLFFRTTGAAPDNAPESVFTDQLFGKWMLLVDPGAGDVLPRERVKRALRTLYTHNLVEDRAAGLRVWVNGMLPGRKPDTGGGVHAKTAWIGAQLDLASLLGAMGDEAASLDVFRSVEASLHDNHLAVGEWNRSVDARLALVVLAEEPGKDTPRFPPYPRYKSAWEYLVRILGFQVDDRCVYLQPFRSLSFGLTDVQLAGVTLTVTVAEGWTRAVVDGRTVPVPVRLDRAVKRHVVAFVR